VALISHMVHKKKHFFERQVVAAKFMLNFGYLAFSTHGTYYVSLLNLARI